MTCDAAVNLAYRCFLVAQEYSGIDYARLQKMESRLRNDVLRESGAMGGRLLVARELIAQGRTLAGGEMEDDFEPVSGLHSIPPPPLDCGASTL